MYSIWSKSGKNSQLSTKTSIGFSNLCTFKWGRLRQHFIIFPVFLFNSSVGGKLRLNNTITHFILHIKQFWEKFSFIHQNFNFLFKQVHFQAYKVWSITHFVFHVKHFCEKIQIQTGALSSGGGCVNIYAFQEGAAEGAMTSFSITNIAKTSELFVWLQWWS